MDFPRVPYDVSSLGMCVARICLSLCGSEQVSVCASGLEHSEADFTGGVLKKRRVLGESNLISLKIQNLGQNLINLESQDLGPPPAYRESP